MSKVSGGIDKAKTFVGEVKTELKKSAWPTRPELVESTVIVIITVLMLGAFVGVSDKVLVMVISLLSK